MYATMRRYHCKPGSVAEIASRVQKGLVPILSKQPGFISYHAIDAGNDIAVSVSVYADRGAADAANKAAAQWVKDNIAQLVGPADITMGAVVATSAQRV